MTDAPAGVPPLFRRPEFRAVAGETLRPGGLWLTARGALLAGFSAGDTVADVGCGPGASVEFLRQRGVRAFGFDADPGYAAEAAARASEGGIAARAEALPLRGGCLDGIVFECVLSVLPDMAAALAEARRALAPGGRLVVADLYLRNGQGGASCPGGSCAGGAVGREVFIERLARAGFAGMRFEDHSRLLAELAGRLIFAGFSAADAGFALAGRACAAGGGRARPGYFLCLAVKEGI